MFGDANAVARRIGVDEVRYSGSFSGTVRSAGSPQDGYQKVTVDGAVVVTEVDQRVRQEAMAQFKPGVVGQVIGGVGFALMANTFIVMPASSLIFGYRIAGSHWAHAGVAFATFLVGIACIAGGLGETQEVVELKKVLNSSPSAAARNARITAGKNPLEFLLKGKDFQFFHIAEVVQLLGMAYQSGAPKAREDEAIARHLVQLNDVLNNKSLSSLFMSQPLVSGWWTELCQKWSDLDLKTPILDAERKRKELDEAARTSRAIANAPGNMFNNVGSMIHRTDPEGAAVLNLVGAGFNGLVNASIGAEIQNETDRAKAKINKDLYASLAAKWQASQDIFRDIQVMVRKLAADNRN